MMNRREEPKEMHSSAHLYKARVRKPTQKATTEREKPTQKATAEREKPAAQPARVGFSFPRKLGGRSFTWSRGKDTDLGAKVAALPPHKQECVVERLQETLAEKTKKLGPNDPQTQQWKEYLGIARKSSRRKNKKKKKKHDKNKGMRKKRSRVAGND
jgi:hypothetical protein